MKDVCPLLNRAGDLVTKQMEKATVLNAFLTLVCTGKICLWQSQVPKMKAGSLEQARLTLRGGGSG